MPASVAAEEPRADDHHHVADRGAGAGRVGQAIALVEEVVGGEVLEQVAERALDHSESSTARGMSRLAFLASSPIEVTDSNPTRIRMAMQAWMKA